MLRFKLGMKDLKERTFNAAGFSFLVYSLASISLSICLVNIKKELNFSLTEAGLFGMLCAIEQTAVLFISPVFAAKFGKIRVLRTSLLLLTLGLICFSLSVSFLTALLSALCMGLGVANMEALLTPIVTDLYPGDSGSKMNKLHAFWPLGSCTGLVGFGWLLSVGISWRFLYAGLAVFAVCIRLSYPSSKKVPLPPSDGSFKAFKKVFALPPFWLFALSLFFAGGAEGAFAFWSATLIQLYLKASAFYAGLVTACFSIGMALGRFLSSRILKKVSLPKMIIICSLAAFAVSLLFIFINSLITLTVFLFIMGTCLACLWPTIQSFAAVILPVDPTALMIFLSCFGVPGYSTASFIMGIIGDRYSLFTAFITVVPAFLILIPVFFAAACKISLINRHCR